MCTTLKDRVNASCWPSSRADPSAISTDCAALPVDRLRRKRLGCSRHVPPRDRVPAIRHSCKPAAPRYCPSGVGVLSRYRHHAAATHRQHSGYAPCTRSARAKSASDAHGAAVRAGYVSPTHPRPHAAKPRVRSGPVAKPEYMRIGPPSYLCLKCNIQHHVGVFCARRPAALQRLAVGGHSPPCFASNCRDSSTTLRAFPCHSPIERYCRRLRQPQAAPWPPVVGASGNRVWVTRLTETSVACAD